MCMVWLMSGISAQVSGRLATRLSTNTLLVRWKKLNCVQRTVCHAHTEFACQVWLHQRLLRVLDLLGTTPAFQTLMQYLQAQRQRLRVQHQHPRLLRTLPVQHRLLDQ